MADTNPLVKKVRSRWFIIIIATAVMIGFNLPKIISRFGDGELASYQNKTDGYAFSYPDSWDKQEGAAPPVSVLFLADAQTGDPASLSVIKIKLDDSAMSLEAFSNGTLQQLKQDHPDLAVITSESTQWAGQNSYRVAHTATYNNRSLKTAQVWTIQGDNVYIMSFGGSPESYGKHQTAAEAAMTSFQFLN